MSDNTNSLLIYIVSDEIRDDDRAELRGLAEQLASSVPAGTEVFFVDQLVSDESHPGETTLPVGIAARVPRIAASPKDERTSLDVVKRLLEAMAEWSRNRAELEVEWDDELIGDIVDGTPSEGVAKTLIGEWERKTGTATQLCRGTRS